jgi:hypothetical protein
MARPSGSEGEARADTLREQVWMVDTMSLAESASRFGIGGSRGATTLGKRTSK